MIMQGGEDSGRGIAACLGERCISIIISDRAASDVPQNYTLRRREMRCDVMSKRTCST